MKPQDRPSRRIRVLAGPALGAFTLAALLVGAPAHAQISAQPDRNTSQKSGNDSECAIAKNPSNKQQLFAACNTSTSGLFAARSTNLGATWTYPDPADKTIADGDAGQGPAACCDPTLAWDTFGNLYLGYIDAGLGNIVVLVSTNGGASFTTLASFPGSVDQPTVVAENTTAPGAPVALWVVWNQGGQMVARGAAVTGPGAIGAFNPLQTIPGTASCSFGDIAIAPSGAVVQACQTPVVGEGPASILVNTDADGLGPGNFGAPVTATTTNVGGFDHIPAQSSRSVDAEAGLAYDRFDGAGALPGFPGPSPHLGRLYLVYTEETVNENDDTDVMVRFSDDDGGSWSAPIRVNDDPAAPVRSQFLPRIASNRLSGNVAVCWHDARNSGGNTAAEEYCSIATPTGATPAFFTNVKISDGASTSTGGGVEFGDYAGLDYFQGRLHPIWGDTSNSTANNPNGTSAFDAYTAEVGGGPAANEGDPHIVTVDGVHYDFQGAGEFVALRGDGLVIQTRQAPIATTFNPGANAYTGLATCVSLNSAVAAAVGSHRVTYEPNLSGVPDPSGLQLRVDGALRTVGASGLDLGDGGRISRTSASGGLAIDFPNGTVLTVTPGFWTSQGKWYLNVDVHHATASEGIMGALARGSWLPALPDGTSVGPRPSGLHERYVALYETFADAWRVTDATSLFDYAPGTSTATFTLDEWPRENPPCTLPQEHPAQPLDAAVAERLCRDVADPNRRANCVFDVTVTGEAGFAQTYLATERVEATVTGGAQGGEDGGGAGPFGGPGLLGGRRLAGSFHVGSAHPLGSFDDAVDSNVHFRLDASYPITDRVRLLAMAGYSQFTAETATGANHPRWINLSLNAQVLFPTASGLRWFVQGGPGAYWPESGSSEAGFNLGFGAQIPLASGPFALELGADYHDVQADEDQRFVTVQLGVLFR